MDSTTQPSAERKRPGCHPVLIAVLVVLNFALLLVFWTPAFVVTGPRDFAAYRSVTYRGYPVVRYGFARLNSETHGTGRNGATKTIGGRCFVEYSDDGVVRTDYGWTLVLRRPFEDGGGLDQSSSKLGDELFLEVR